jgi:hypothetical protein
VRYETQRRDRIFAALEVEASGVPQTGLTPTAIIRRVSDGKFWDGAEFAVGSTSIDMTEVDQVNLPGLYRVDLNSEFLDMELGAEGYEVAMTESVNSVRELLVITPIDGGSDDPVYQEAIPVALQSQDVLRVDSGSTARIVVTVTTTPPVSGKAGAWLLGEMLLCVGEDDDGVIDLEDDGVEMPTMVESASPVDGGATASVTGDPVFEAEGGPQDEDVYEVPVDDSTDFEIGDLVRGVRKPDGQGLVHRVVGKGSGILRLHAHEGQFDIVDGDTLEVVEGSGVYVGFVDLSVDDYLSVSQRRATFRMSAITLMSGDGPKWDQAAVLSWVRTVELTVNPGYRTG